MRCHRLTIQIALIAAIRALAPSVATAQSPDSLAQRHSPSARADSTGYDLAMGFHYGGAAQWSVALGAERYRHDAFRHSTLLLIEPGRRADRLSLGTGSQTGDDLATALATNVRASCLRVRTPSPHASAGTYGGLEAQLLFLGVGARVGVFTSGFGRKPVAMIDLSAGF